MGVYGGPNKVKGGIVFSLDGANPASYAGDSVTSLGTDYGYFGGGSSSSYTTIDRIDFSNDTATAAPKGTLSTIRDNLQGGATGSTSYGYFGGGYATGAPGSPDARSSVDRVDYSNDTPTATAKGPLSFTRTYAAATGNNSFGYWAGSQGTYSTVDRLDYSSDTTTAAVKGPLSANTYGAGATGNSNFGYIGGVGVLPTPTTTVNRIDYSNDTPTASTKGTLSVVRYNNAATGNASFGYFAGGGWPSSSIVSSIDRIDYSSDTSTASPKGPLTSTRYALGATSSASYGYFGGGFADPSDGISTMDRIDYSSDTSTASPKGPLSDGRKWVGGVSSKDNALPTTSSSTRSATQIKGSPYGYIAQGFRGSHPSPNSSTTERIDFSNDTATTTPTGNQTQSAHYSKGVGNNNYGYMLSGTPSGNSVVSRIDYSNDSAACAPKGPLAYGAWEAGATGNASYGYHGGGYNQAASARTSKVQRLDYSSDTSTAVEKGPLAANHYRTAATGNLSYGYWGGGNIVPSPSISSFVSRLDYSSDTTTAVEKGPLANPWREGGAVGNTSYGYWAGNDPVPSNASTLQRLEWANDTVAASTKGNLTANKKQVTATGSDSFGYFSGGLAPWPDRISTVDRVDYSNDTATASPRGPLSAIGYGMASVSSQENALGAETIYPWYDTSGRGNNANITDSRFRATDGGYFTFDGTGDFLTVPSTNAFAFGTGDFSVEYWVKTGQGSVGNDYGYNAGGRTPGSTDHTTVDRIDFSNDTATLVAKGPLSENRSYAASITSQSYGYAANSFLSPRTSVERIDYANDTATGVQKGAMAASSYYRAGSSNTNYGWVSGGPAWSGTTLVDRIDFADDTATALLRGNLSISRHHPQAVGNVSYGYHYGGQNSGSSPGYLSSVERIDYGNDTATATPKGPLTAVTRYGAQTGAGNADYGYVNKVGNITSTTIDRIDYSNDTATALSRSTLQSSPNKYIDATVSTSQYGYWMGGFPSSTLVYRLDFSNDTVAASEKGNTSLGRGYTTGHSSRMHGFPTTGPLTAANIINPDSETGSGYWAHQYDTTFDWNSEYGDGSSLGTNYGYITGNSAPAYTTTNNRIDFASDTGTTPTKGPLSAAKGYHRGMSSLSYGYLGGGYHPSVHPGYSTVDRLDYSSDTDTATPKGQLTQNMVNGGGAGNTSYGYIGGGSPSTSLINRIDYGNDTSTALAKGPLNTARNGLNATGNLSYGYWGGGHTGWPNFVSTIDRIDYSNDTPTASPKGALSQKREGVAATSNASYGYWGGGYDSPPSVYTSLVDRVDFSNDTATAVAKGPLTVGRRRIGGATGTTSYGYWGGGETTPGGKVTTVDRLDYSSDSTTTSPKGPLSAIAMQQGTVSSRANGFPTTSATTELYNCALSPVNDGDWHNVVITRVGGTQQAYYDGVGITTTGGTYTDGTDYSGVDGWFIGKGGGTAFNGDLANITIRKGKGLSSDEVQQNFNALKSRFGV